jgi:hypothetical protein
MRSVRKFKLFTCANIEPDFSTCIDNIEPDFSTCIDFAAEERTHANPLPVVEEPRGTTFEKQLHRRSVLLMGRRDYFGGSLSRETRALRVGSLDLYSGLCPAWIQEIRHLEIPPLRRAGLTPSLARTNK